MTKYAGRAPYPFTPGDNMTGQCSVCGLAFYGERAFDTHRRGEEPERHCIDPADPPSRKDGAPERWSLDKRGRWHLGTEDDRAKVAARLRGAHSDPGGQDSARATALPGIPGTPRAQADPESGNPA